MRLRPRAAFVVTASLLGAEAGCHGGGECKPPDCHVNPPRPDPAPTFANNPPSVELDAGADDAGLDPDAGPIPSDPPAPSASPPIHYNPPPPKPPIHRNPPSAPRNPPPPKG